MDGILAILTDVSFGVKGPNFGGHSSSRLKPFYSIRRFRGLVKSRFPDLILNRNGFAASGDFYWVISWPKSRIC